MSLGPAEIALIVLLALLLFGAGRIADIGKGLGQGISNFKKGLRDAESDQSSPKQQSEAKKLEAETDRGSENKSS